VRRRRIGSWIQLEMIEHGVPHLHLEEEENLFIWVLHHLNWLLALAQVEGEGNHMVSVLPLGEVEALPRGLAFSMVHYQVLLVPFSLEINGIWGRTIHFDIHV
jgi:hypothetical protein